MPLILGIDQVLVSWALEKERFLCCLNPASCLPVSAGGEFTQPRDHSLAQPCMYVVGRAQFPVPTSQPSNGGRRSAA